MAIYQKSTIGLTHPLDKLYKLTHDAPKEEDLSWELIHTCLLLLWGNETNRFSCFLKHF